MNQTISSSWVELQEFGVVGLIAAALIPGFLWTAKAPTGTRMAARAALTGGIIVAIIALEAKLDNSANKLADVL